MNATVSLIVHVLALAAAPVSLLVIASGFLQNIIYVWQLILASRALRRRPPQAAIGELWRHYADSAPPIALLVPAFNEEATVVESVRALLALRYPNYEIIVINDGSRDNTLKVLIEAFALRPLQRHYDLAAPCKPIQGVYVAQNQPRLVVIDKLNGGKADALNAGINLARASIICSIDADSLLEADALLRAVGPFVEDPEHTVAVGGTIRVANGCVIDHGQVVHVGLPKNGFALLQTVEYLRAFLMARLAWSEAKCLTIISGAFGLFRRQAVLDVGGYRHDTVGEDMELVVKIHRFGRETGRDYRIVFVPEPVCWTEVPETMGVLGRQRVRWQRGALETFFAHIDLLFNPHYGRVGLIAFGSVFLFDVVGPVLETLGYVLIPVFYLLGALSLVYLKAFAAVSFLFGVVISVGSLALEEAELRRFPTTQSLVVLLAAAIIENFGYRQLNNFWRIKGYWQFLRRRRDWGSMARRGFRTS
ncbi:MAG: glycosyltransferase [Alphaproteobacteria bacterium]|nr:glycosyltransferase [Alphaproteobacteria bacterium]